MCIRDRAGDVKDASLKASPSLRGVVIDKKLYSRVIKTRSEKNADKAIPVSYTHLVLDAG